MISNEAGKRGILHSMSLTFAKGVGRIRGRDFIALVGGAVAWISSARAQTMPVIGYLGSENPERYSSRLRAFREGLAEAGYTEGKNVAIEFRWAEGQYNRLPALAKDLASDPINVIVAAGGAEVALAAKAATATIPIVFEMGGDPIALGVVGSLSRPGGHLTGVSSLSWRFRASAWSLCMRCARMPKYLPLPSTRQARLQTRN